MPTDQETNSQELPARWRKETLFFSGDDFFDALASHIACAISSVTLESYIFEGDDVGERVFNELRCAVARGVYVRVIVDGIGSPRWRSVYGERALNAGIQFRVFHELPWERLLRGRPPGARRERLGQLFIKMNNRNHRKVCIVDQQLAFVGSVNVSAVHSVRVNGSSAWRDIAVCVEGAAVAVLSQSFEDAWSGRLRRFTMGFRRRIRAVSPLVFLNTRRRDRRRNYLTLIRKIFQAERRICITNAYFVPHRSLLGALSHASGKGVDVRLIVPKHSDVFFMPIVTAALREGMLKAGAKMFEYVPSMLHTKSMVIDDWCLVGSSNLNHRSLFHDLEADVVLLNEESCTKLLAQFTADLEQSELVSDTGADFPWYQRILARVLLLIKFVL